MPQSEQLEVLVLGSGTGGKLITWYMAPRGATKRARVQTNCLRDIAAFGSTLRLFDDDSRLRPMIGPGPSMDGSGGAT